MKNMKGLGPNLLGVIGYFIIAAALFVFVWNYMLGPYKDYQDDEWISRQDMVSNFFGMFIIGAILVVIDLIVRKD